MFATAFILTLASSAALAAPQSYNRRPAGSSSGGNFTPGRPIIPIISDFRNGPENGVYDFNFETGNGIRVQENGSPVGPNGAVVSQGGWSFTFPDGTPAQFSFIADENGYRVESPLLPTPPPMPAHALEQIAKAERERAQGISFDSSGRRVSGGRGRPNQYS